VKGCYNKDSSVSFAYWLSDSISGDCIENEKHNINMLDFSDMQRERD